ncbi:hypothetical protein OnM2_022065 [Erysiphe neolycopersici]|uniref:Uncharacterized protein n=1 Tax=Erysiphe neolycopersici TaxID=212602 RepID=A0A420I2L0_9PEZI|nr:hypothetical protein OnM2_022065 [Erysiphe neolycopersici]
MAIITISVSHIGLGHVYTEEKERVEKERRQNLGIENLDSEEEQI